MKKLSLVMTMLVTGLAGVHPPAAAQGTVVIERFITVGSSEPGPQSPQAARQEAAAAMAEARRECRKESDRESREQCLAAAREDYRDLMEEARQRTP